MARVLKCWTYFKSIIISCLLKIDRIWIFLWLVYLEPRQIQAEGDALLLLMSSSNKVKTEQEKTRVRQQG